ncbi:hypothetical protein [Kitasatospora sp. NPDC057015]|uniref:hypothetical protein n=1 Tax=Kitasatospora sp. NPDC057015 TaxID=3346001 RepID=UPI0036343A3B
MNAPQPAATPAPARAAGRRPPPAPSTSSSAAPSPPPHSEHPARADASPHPRPEAPRSPEQPRSGKWTRHVRTPRARHHPARPPPPRGPPAAHHPTLGRIADTRPDEDLTAAGYVDLAHHYGDRIGGNSPLTPTAGYSKAGQGGEQRIDRAYADPQIARALLSFDVVRALEHISDHRPLLTEFDLDRLRAAVGAAPC